MLLLTTTSDKLQVVTDVVCAVDVHASYMDYDGSAVTPGRKNTAITTAATTDVVASPAISTTRNVKALHVANVHATDPVTVTINHTDGTTVVQLEKVPLLAGERISYREGVGMRVIDVNGAEKLAVPLIVTKQAATDHAISATAATEVTELTIPCDIGTWIFEYFLVFRSATTTVGPKLSVNFDGTVTTFVQTLTSLSGLTTDSLGVIDQAATAPQVMAGMAARAKDATGSMIWTAGVDTANADEMIKIEGVAVITVAGNFELWHGSETATSTTVMAGSGLRLTKVG